jgi:hypothetical protein
VAPQGPVGEAFWGVAHSLDIGLLDSYIPQVGVFEVRFVQIRSGEVGVNQIGVGKVGIPELRAA